MSGAFVTGGTIKPGEPSYVERHADAELYAALAAGEYCSILTARQMGKSSLMARTAVRLKAEGVACATVDLQGRGDATPPPPQWYYGIAKQIADGLQLGPAWSEWWKQQQELLLPAEMLIQFVGDVVLNRCPGRVVIFIDEVDWMIRLPFSDEFFAAIRSCFNRRATSPAFERLTCVLLGSAAPAQLIKDNTRTPFNIGRRIELTDFTIAEVRPLADQLGAAGEAILSRVLYWTGGHPYLTQILCAKADREPRRSQMPPEALVDALVSETLLASGARQAEDNIMFVSDRLTRSGGDRSKVLRTYLAILAGRTVMNAPSSPVHTVLRLSGVVRVEPDGRLRVRNRVYERVFDRAWARAQLPWNVPVIAAAAVVLLAVAASTAYYVGFRRAESRYSSDEALRAFRSAASMPPADEDYFHDMDSGRASSRDAVIGRNAWMVWTAGNDRFWNLLTDAAGLDLLKAVSSHPTQALGRDSRFRQSGVINEPCFRQATGPDPNRYGLWLDVRDSTCLPDPFSNPDKYPGMRIGARGTTVPVGSYYGEPSGVVGLRLFPNPDFDDAARRRWDAERYYRDPAYYSAVGLVRPYRVGVACAFCHVGLNPVRPPSDPEHPQWQNLSGIAGAQNLVPERVFAAAGNAFEQDYLFQVLHTWRPGTFDLSFFATDGINNPTAMGPLYGLSSRLQLARRFGQETVAGERLPGAEEINRPEGPFAGLFRPPDTVWAPRLRIDASDSAGLMPALLRFYLNLGVFSEELLLHFTPLTQRAGSPPLNALQVRDQSAYYRATEQVAPSIAQYLLAAGVTGPALADAPGGKAYLTADPGTIRRGATVFADRCASCHSSKLPDLPPGLDLASCGGPAYLECWNRYWTWTQTETFRNEMRTLTSSADFLRDNALSTDLRVPVTLIESNVCSALGTSALDGWLWQDFSTNTYKMLPAAGRVQVSHPENGASFEFQLPAGGRGYVRPPSLIGVWSTAPFLTNNTVGSFSTDPSVQARVSRFEDAIGQLLWPERRQSDPVFGRGGAMRGGTLDRTTAPTIVRGLFVGSGVDMLIPSGIPVGLFANLDLAGDGLDPAQRQEQLVKVQALFSRLSTAAKAGSQDAFTGIGDTMLSLSKCPDLIVNRGHYFGADMSDDDKRALIEFVKTF